MTFKDKETKLDKSDAINFVWVAESFFIGVIAGVLLSVFVMMIGK